MKDSPRPPFRLIKREAPVDVKAAMRKLLEEADHDEIMGIAHIIMYGDGHFNFVLTGECHRNPLYVRALALELDDELSVMTK